MTYALDRQLAFDYQLDPNRTFALNSPAVIYWEWRRYQLDRAGLSDGQLSFAFRNGLVTRQDLLLIAGKTALIRYTNTGEVPLLAVTALDWACNGVTKSLGDGITLISGNEFTVELTVDDTEELKGAYMHEASVTDASGTYPLTRGTLIVKKTILS